VEKEEEEEEEGGGGGGEDEKEEEEIRGTEWGTTRRKTGNKISCSKFSPGVFGGHKTKATT
jgi:hypothetical protein